MEEQLVEIDQESKVPETGSDSEDLGPEPEMETETEPVPKRAKKHKSSKCGILHIMCTFVHVFSAKLKSLLTSSSLLQF